jgi:hypothetical protein
MIEDFLVNKIKPEVKNQVAHLYSEESIASEEKMSF